MPCARAHFRWSANTRGDHRRNAKRAPIVLIAPMSAAMPDPLKSANGRDAVVDAEIGKTWQCLAEARLRPLAKALDLKTWGRCHGCGAKGQAVLSVKWGRFGQAADGAPSLRNRKFADSLLEGIGFELLVRGRGEAGCRAF